jgi:dynein intermediate chain 1
VREVVRPAAQLALTAAELEEEIGRSLTAGNPAAPANIVRYSYRERVYRPEPIIDQQLQHFTLGGCLLLRQSDEASRDSAVLLAQSRRATAQSRRATQQPQAEASSLHAEPSSSGLPPGAAAAHASATIGEDDAAAARLRNQFNFVDRAAQTGHCAPRERGSMTEPPPTASASGFCSRWEIFQAYVQDQDRQRQSEELARQKAQVARRGGGGGGQQQQQQQQAAGAAAAGILALVVNGQVGGRAGCWADGEVASLPCQRCHAGLVKSCCCHSTGCSAAQL